MLMKMLDVNYIPPNKVRYLMKQTVGFFFFFWFYFVFLCFLKSSPTNRWKRIMQRYRYRFG